MRPDIWFIYWAETRKRGCVITHTGQHSAAQHKAEQLGYSWDIFSFPAMGAGSRGRGRCLEAALITTSLNLLLSGLVSAAWGQLPELTELCWTGLVQRECSAWQPGPPPRAPPAAAVPGQHGVQQHTAGGGPGGGAGHQSGQLGQIPHVQVTRVHTCELSRSDIVPNLTSLHRWGPPGRLSLPTARFASAPRPRWTDWTSWWSWYSGL